MMSNELKAVKAVISFYTLKVEELQDRKKSEDLNDNQLYIVNHLIRFYNDKIDDLKTKL
ncbi:hypothetical protein [Methanobrevibacter boviskoreani]|uniref:hypothetical protein n=1 Tax=Methanobrevibacter boviskoreani TaxID=1348249 RepID=UPI0023F36611|nr:hypothetical protein [Methanobrevibacter boviskoreani]MDD6256507.1 hypothetical protein [Methanobrevibacter boviskoreani]